MKTASVDLDSLIPSPKVAEGYINRNLRGFRDFDVYDAAMESGHNILIEGPTGSGKTFSWRAYAAYKGLPFYTVTVNGNMDNAMLVGSYSPTEDGSLEWVDGVITSMVRQRRGVLLWDEISMGAERTLARWYDLWDARREMVLYEHHGEVLRVPPGSDFLIGAAYNPGYRGGRELSQALPNRYAFKFEFDYDEEIEAELVPVVAVRELARKLRTMKREVRTPVSTNMQIEFCEIALAFSVEFAIENWVTAFATGERESVAQVTKLHAKMIETEIAALAEGME